MASAEGEILEKKNRPLRLEDKYDKKKRVKKKKKGKSKRSAEISQKEI